MAPIRDFDYTMLSTYMNCQRRFYFRHLLDLEGLGRQTAPEFGHAMHAGLNVWHQTRDLTKAIGAFKEDWTKSGGDTQEDSKRTLEKGTRILKGYAVKYADEPFKVLENECPFEITMPNGLVYIGRRDRVIDWDGAIRVLEHKTSSQLGFSTFNAYNPNMQILGYIFSARQKYPSCYAAVVDILQVAKTKEDYARKVETRTDDEIAQFPKLFNDIAQDVNESIEKNRFVPNYSLCTYYGECPYRRICMQSPENWQRIIDSDYKKSHWDPRHTDDAGE